MLLIMLRICFADSTHVGIFPEKTVIILSSTLFTSVGRASVESRLGKTVLIQNEEPTYFASLNLGKNLEADSKKRFLFVIGGF